MEGKHDFTVLNNGVLRKGDNLVKRQKACETFTYDILPTLTRLYHSNEDLTNEQISMVAKRIVFNVSTIVIQARLLLNQAFCHSCILKNT